MWLQRDGWINYVYYGMWGMALFGTIALVHHRKLNQAKSLSCCNNVNSNRFKAQ